MATSSARDRRDEARRAAALAVIQKRFREPQCSVSSVAEELHLSVRQLYRSFVGHESPSEIISRVRTSAAITLLLNDRGLPAPEVARRAGFVDPGTMREHLRRLLGMGSREIRSQCVKLSELTRRSPPAQVSE
ncbi:helix-turn-helix domain-containing protein [Microbacterium sp. NPDC091662]|uniref:helix-turn-helix domain-containing protein n=1 Tax=Microbacterium sp. NPDC091662 TaxID=3364211 RepID=UPI00381C4332